MAPASFQSPLGLHYVLSCVCCVCVSKGKGGKCWKPGAVRGRKGVGGSGGPLDLTKEGPLANNSPASKTLGLCMCCVVCVFCVAIMPGVAPWSHPDEDMRPFEKKSIWNPLIEETDQPLVATRSFIFIPNDFYTVNLASHSPRPAIPAHTHDRRLHKPLPPFPSINVSLPHVSSRHGFTPCCGHSR